MHKKILISIIVPIYNIETYVVQCIESIIKQTYTEIEIILVDDGSTDNSSVICDEYAKLDGRISVIHKLNGGLSDARNIGLDAIHGDYIMFIDGDDYIAPNMCEKLINAVLKHNADIGICNCQIIGDKKDRTSADDNIIFKIRDEVLSGVSVIEERVITPYGWVWSVSWNKLYRKELFEYLRFPLGRLHEDEFIFFDLFSQCNLIACVDEPLYYYVRRNGSITTSPYSIRRLDICEAFIKRVDNLLSHGYSSNCVYKTAMSCIILLCDVFEHGLYFEPDCQVRYREILQRFRELGFIKLFRNAHGIKRKLLFVTSYINPALYWKLISLKKYLSHAKWRNK